MGINSGSDKIKEIYYGSDKIKEVYHGSDLVWKMDSGIIQDGYWVHKDTGVITYFGLEDSSIEDGIMGYPSWMPNCSEVQLPSGVTGFKTYNWVIEEWGNYEVTYTGFVHSKETYTAQNNDILIEVDLSNTSISSIGLNSFSWCFSLTSITLPESVVSLGEYSLSECYALTSITLPESVVSLGEGCFTDCRALTSINIPESVVSLGEYCFSRCYSLTSITLPESLTSLVDYTFSECTSLTSVNIPVGVVSLGEYTFSECTSLTSVNIPEGVTSLGEFCFYNCTSLTSITLPESVVSLGSGCFYWCPSLTLATVLPAIPPSIGEEVFGEVHTSFNIKVHSPYVNAYKTATNWKSYASKISAI